MKKYLTNIGKQIKIFIPSNNIFINLFISQYYKFECKLQFCKGNDDAIAQWIESFSKGMQYFALGAFPKLLTNDNKNQKYKSPLIFTIKSKDKVQKEGDLGTFSEIDISEKGLKKYNSEEDYLKELKNIFSLDNLVSDNNCECDNIKKSLLSIINKDGYIITDNFKKMIRIIYRIEANIPVILMGETGWGKTALIKKLNQLLNNGEETLEIININLFKII